MSSAAVARALTTDEYRLYGLAIAAITTLLLWSDLGITSAVARYTPELEQSGRSTTRRFLKFAARLRVVGLLLAVLVLLAIKGRGEAESVLPFHGLSFALIVGVAVVQSLARVKQYFLTGLLERKAVGSILLVVGLVQSVLVIAAALTGGSLNGILVALLLTALTELALTNVRASRQAVEVHSSGTSSGEPASGFYRNSARFAAVSFAEKTASYLSSSFFVIFLIAAFGTGQDVALFAIAGEFAIRGVSLLAVPFSGITLPLFSTLDARGRPGDTAAALRYYIMLLVLLYVPTAGFLSCLSPSLVPLIYSERYAGAAAILTVLVPFLFLEYTVYSALLAALMTREKYIQVLTSKLPLFVGLPTIVLIIPEWGAVGAAAVLGLTRLASAAILLIFGIREFRFLFPIRFTLKMLVVTSGAVVVISILQGRGDIGWIDWSGWGGLVALVAAGAVTFLVIYKVLGGIEAADRERMLAGVPQPLARILNYLL